MDLGKLPPVENYPYGKLPSAENYPPGHYPPGHYPRRKITHQYKLPPMTGDCPL